MDRNEWTISIGISGRFGSEQLAGMGRNTQQEGICNLYAGAIGLFKNPSSHRDVNLADPVEAVELIMLADLLIRMAKRRRPGEQPRRS